MSKLITITGPSGSGKSTIADILVNKYNLKKAISYTSRPMRPNEQHGKDYYFTTKDEIQEMYSAGRLAEYTEYNGNLYGLHIDELSRSDIVIVDPNGLRNLLKLNKFDIHSLFLNVYPRTQLQRLLNRGDSYNDAIKRIENDKLVFDSTDPMYDVIVTSKNSHNFNEQLAKRISEWVDVSVSN